MSLIGAAGRRLKRGRVWPNYSAIDTTLDIIMNNVTPYNMNNCRARFLDPTSTGVTGGIMVETLCRTRNHDLRGISLVFR